MKENPLCDFNEVHKEVLISHENNIFTEQFLLEF